MPAFGSINAELLGAAAATLTTVSFVPQALQVIRTRDTAAISLTMYAMFTAGVCLWGVYGFATGQISIIVANAVTLVLAATILAIKMRNTLRHAAAARNAQDRPG